MKSLDVREKYIKFFEKNGHFHIPSAGLLPENDPTTLFISSGMQPLLKYFLGEKHPNGNRIVNSQVCLRAHGFMDDLLEVGDNRHTSLFEMLGNWSFGDYFKKESIVDLDIRTKGIKMNKRSFMNLEITLFVDNFFDVRSSEIKNLLKKFLHSAIDTCLTDKTLYNFNKTKI